MSYTNEQIQEKWVEVLDYARQNATGEGLHRGFRWLQDSFNECFDMMEATPGWGGGGQPNGRHNREVLAGKICLELGEHVGGRHLIDAAQEDRLRTTLKEIVDSPVQSHHLGR